MGRPLTAREQAILDHLLSRPFPGRDELRAQAAAARVEEQCGCGCASVSLATDPGAPAAHAVARHVEAPARTTGDDAAEFEVMLFVRDGRLDSLELVDYRAGPPRSTFPPPSAFAEPLAAD